MSFSEVESASIFPSRFRAHSANQKSRATPAVSPARGVMFKDAQKDKTSRPDRSAMLNASSITIDEHGTPAGAPALSLLHAINI